MTASAAAHLGTRATELLDGRLCAADELLVRQHLASCRDCAGVVQAQQTVRATLRRLDAPGPTPDLLAGLLAVSAASGSPLSGPRLPTAALRPTGAPRPSRSRLTSAVVGTVGLASAGALGVAAFTGLSAPAPAAGRVPAPSPIVVPASGTGSTGGATVLGRTGGTGPDVVPAVFRVP